MSPETIGWYGLGSMGIKMALNLQRHLSAQGMAPLRYSNRTLSKGEELQKIGAIPEPEFEELVNRSSIIFTMITDDQVLEKLVAEVLQKDINLQGKIWIDTSTVHPETCHRCFTKLTERGATFVASPVFGASPVAAEGKLIFAIAGTASAIDRLRPFIIDVMGRKMIEMGEDVRKSSLLKISGNIFVLGFQELIAEAQVFAEKSELGTAQMEEFIGIMFGPVLQSYSRRMTSGAYAPPLNVTPGFSAALATKDCKHALSMAQENGTRLKTLEAALGHLIAAREYAGESLDSSSMYGAVRLEAELPFWNGNSRQSN
ncbi:unnamed protein product [Clonostachys chloroleuca]|uniref:6-phosphogluconate dehydrogenase NADP-binding domain-containing protein n=1 Tax=Clonostachys chloroleuca TaxID=1926264 RepID=A0AA35M2T1_9HYPO|nr:unnamed protein product [Clonostachys chloroleuca]